MFSTTGYPFYLYSRLLTIFESIFGRLLPTLVPEKYDLSGKTAVVTGANVGIGLETARSLAAFGGTVILACRNQEKAEKARSDIIDNSKGQIRPDQVEVRILDCSDLDSVRYFVDGLGNRTIDILVNNAGMVTGDYKKTKQGFETSYATNMLSHYLLTLMLLSKIDKYGRIVNVSSDGHYSIASEIDINDLDHSKHFEEKLGLKEGGKMEGTTTFDNYARAKLMQIMFTKELQTRLDKSDKYKDKAITVHTFHPGLVKSDIWERPGGTYLKGWGIILFIVNLCALSTEQGAATGVHLATSIKAIQDKGQYWQRMAVRGPLGLVEDVALRSLLWEKWAEESKLDSSLRL